jgi:hypothetical protein
MPLSDDPWIAKNSQIAAEKLHALGVINYRWNLAELALKVIFSQIAGIPFARMWAIAHDMGDAAISAAMAELLEMLHAAKGPKNAILHGLELYDINRVNRNQLTHYLPAALVGSDFTRLKGPKFDPKPFSDDLKDLRRVADDLEALLKYFSQLTNAITDLQAPPRGRERHSLPDRLPLPEKLWKPPQTKPQGSKARPDKGP